MVSVRRHNSAVNKVELGKAQRNVSELPPEKEGREGRSTTPPRDKGGNNKSKSPGPGKGGARKSGGAGRRK